MLKGVSKGFQFLGRDVECGRQPPLSVIDMEKAVVEEMVVDIGDQDRKVIATPFKWGSLSGELGYDPAKLEFPEQFQRPP